LVLGDVGEVVEDQQVVLVELGDGGFEGELAPGGPKTSRLSPFSSQLSPATSAMTWALEIIGTASKSKASRLLPGGRRASAR
jgi:hypothetical protein